MNKIYKLVQKVKYKMVPSMHFLVSLLIAVLLYPIFSWNVLMIFIGGVLIDVDHYLLYIYRFGKFSLKGCYKYHHVDVKKNHHKDVFGALLIFHTIEFLLLSAFLSLYYTLALIFTVGLLAHYTLDIIERYRLEKSFITNPSLMAWIIKNKIQKD